MTYGKFLFFCKNHFKGNEDIELNFKIILDLKFNFSKDTWPKIFEKRIPTFKLINIFYLLKRSKRNSIYRLIGVTHFLNNRFHVNKKTLIPRKETELLTETLIKVIEKTFNNQFSLLDLCSGSGVIGLSIKKAIPQSKVTLLDKSVKANKIAKKNSELLKVKADIFDSNLFQKLKYKRFNVIVSNPPYLSKIELRKYKSQYKKDPKISLLANDTNGIYFYAKILSQINDHLTFSKKSIVAFEFGYNQKLDVQKLLKKYLPKHKHTFYKDYDGNWRFSISVMDKNHD